MNEIITWLESFSNPNMATKTLELIHQLRKQNEIMRAGLITFAGGVTNLITLEQELVNKAFKDEANRLLLEIDSIE